jgi:hypothetical protein
MAYTKYSLTPADNNAAPPNGAPEGMLPSAVNDTMRDMMAQIRDVGDGIRGGTYTMTAPVITGGSVTGVTAVSTSGNLAFTGTSNRITGDFSNATVASRVAFQNSVTNGSTNITMLPNGTSQATTVNFEGSNDGLNCSTFQVGQTATVAQLNASIRGTGTYLPLVMNTGGSERLRIDASGNLLLNTTAARAGFFNSSANSPIAQIEGTTTNSASLSVVRNSADTVAPFLILGKTRGTAVGATTAVAGSDNIGTITFQGSDGTELVEGARIICRVDGTPGANDMPGALIFQTTADGAASSTERMRIDSSGRILAGTTATFGGANSVFNAAADCVSAQCFAANNTNTGAVSQYVIPIYRNGSLTGGITNTDTATGFATSSDYRLKENIAPMTGALAKVAALKPVTYKWKVNGSNGQGFIAHELQAVVPDCVIGEKDAVESQKYEISPAIPATYDEEGNELTPFVQAVIGEREVPVYQGIDTSFLVATLTAAIQELKATVDAQTARIAALEGTA